MREPEADSHNDESEDNSLRLGMRILKQCDRGIPTYD